MSTTPKQLDMFKAETTWFHVFVSIVENGDVARMGPYAITVYLVIKAYTNWKTGRAFPGIDTIVEKSGMSRAQVMRSLAILTEHGYLDKAKAGRQNVYTLREKVTFNDEEGRPAAVATWDYLPSTVEAARAELKRFMLTGENDGKIIFVENLNLNVQINPGDHNVNNLGDLTPRTAEALAKMRAAMDRAQEKARNKKS